MAEPAERRLALACQRELPGPGLPRWGPIASLRAPGQHAPPVLI